MWAVIEFNINIEWHKKRDPDDDVWTNARKWENDNVWLSLRIGGAAERRDIERRGKRQIAWWSTETNSSSTFCRRYRKMNKTFSTPRCTSETAANFYLIFPSNLSFIYFAPKSCIALRIVYQLANSHSVMLGSFTAHCRVELLCGRGRRIAMQCTTLLYIISSSIENAEYDLRSNDESTFVNNRDNDFSGMSERRKWFRRKLRD